MSNIINLTNSDPDDIQPIFDELAKQSSKRRAMSQMTLGELIDDLSSRPHAQQVAKVECGHSYRGYYNDLAFEPSDGTMNAGDLLEACLELEGSVLYGYKGGEYAMTRSTPVWIAYEGNCGKKLISICPSGELLICSDD